MSAASNPTGGPSVSGWVGEPVLPWESSASLRLDRAALANELASSEYRGLVASCVRRAAKRGAAVVTAEDVQRSVDLWLALRADDPSATRPATEAARPEATRA